VGISSKGVFSPGPEKCRSTNVEREILNPPAQKSLLDPRGGEVSQSWGARAATGMARRKREQGGQGGNNTKTTTSKQRRGDPKGISQAKMHHKDAKFTIRAPRGTKKLGNKEDRSKCGRGRCDRFSR